MIVKKIILIIGAVFLLHGICVLTDAIADGEVTSLKDFKYWEDGMVKQCDIYDARKGRLRSKVFYLYGGGINKVEKFDERGNKIEEALYDGHGKLKAGLDGWAAMRWHYEGMQLAWQVSYDEYGKPIEQKFYTESGKLAMRLYRDDNAVNPYVNAAMFTMLGAQNNIGYYNSHRTIEEATRVVTE